MLLGTCMMALQPQQQQQQQQGVRGFIPFCGITTDAHNGNNDHSAAMPTSMHVDGHAAPSDARTSAPSIKAMCIDEASSAPATTATATTTATADGDVTMSSAIVTDRSKMNQMGAGDTFAPMSVETATHAGPVVIAPPTGDPLTSTSTAGNAPTSSTSSMCGGIMQSGLGAATVETTGANVTDTTQGTVALDTHTAPLSELTTAEKHQGLLTAHAPPTAETPSNSTIGAADEASNTGTGTGTTNRKPSEADGYATATAGAGSTGTPSLSSDANSTTAANSDVNSSLPAPNSAETADVSTDAKTKPNAAASEAASVPAVAGAQSENKAKSDGAGATTGTTVTEPQIADSAADAAPATGTATDTVSSESGSSERAPAAAANTERLLAVGSGTVNPAASSDVDPATAKSGDAALDALVSAQKNGDTDTVSTIEADLDAGARQTLPATADGEHDKTASAAPGTLPTAAVPTKETGSPAACATAAADTVTTAVENARSAHSEPAATLTMIEKHDRAAADETIATTSGALVTASPQDTIDTSAAVTTLGIFDGADGLSVRLWDGRMRY